MADLPDTVRLVLSDSLGRGFCPPAQGRVLSRYGPRGRRVHNGTDVKVASGQEIYAAFDGIVRWSGWNRGGFGNVIIIRHPSGLETFYAHLSKRTVEAGDYVEAGQVIGTGGRTGRASGTHLHFEARYADQSFDPERLIDFVTGELRVYDFALKRDYFSSRSRAGDPERQPGEPEEQYHTIRSGDNLSTLARRYGTSVSDLCRMNGIASTATLRVGRTLRVR